MKDRGRVGGHSKVALLSSFLHLLRFFRAMPTGSPNKFAYLYVQTVYRNWLNIKNTLQNNAGCIDRENIKLLLRLATLHVRDRDASWMNKSRHTVCLDSQFQSYNNEDEVDVLSVGFMKIYTR